MGPQRNPFIVSLILFFRIRLSTKAEGPSLIVSPRLMITMSDLCADTSALAPKHESDPTPAANLPYAHKYNILS